LLYEREKKSDTTFKRNINLIFCGNPRRFDSATDIFHQKVFQKQLTKKKLSKKSLNFVARIENIPFIEPKTKGRDSLL